MSRTHRFQSYTDGDTLRLDPRCVSVVQFLTACNWGARQDERVFKCVTEA